MSRARETATWLAASTSALAVHLGVGLFVLEALPAAEPPEQETQILVESIQMGRSSVAEADSAEQPEQATAAAAEAAQASTQDAEQAENAQAAKAEQTAAETLASEDAQTALQEDSTAAAQQDSADTDAATPEVAQAPRITGEDAAAAPEQETQADAAARVDAPSALAQEQATTALSATAAPPVIGQEVTAPAPLLATPAAPAPDVARAPAPSVVTAAPTVMASRPVGNTVIGSSVRSAAPVRSAASAATTSAPARSVAPSATQRTSAAPSTAPARSLSGTAVATAPTRQITGSTARSASVTASAAPRSVTGTAVAAAAPSPAAAPLTGQVQTAQPQTAPAQVVQATAALAPTRVPDFVPSAVADAQDQARYGAIVDYLRAYRSDSACFAALPTVSGQTGALELDTFGLQSKDLAGFTQGLEQEAGLTPDTYQREITDAQCAALRFVTGLRDYPAFSLSIDLANRDIPNGGFLSGAIRHSGARDVHLLLVDDEGSVLVLDGFLRDQDTARSFDVGPLQQTAEGVVTQQLLLALAVPKALPVLVAAAEAGGMPAVSFFEQLTAQVSGDVEAATGLGLVAFAVVE